jgi:hypothetical protein
MGPFVDGLKLHKTKICGDPSTTTFTPLARGWYRCNQTGKRYKQNQLEAIRSARAGASKNSRPKKSSKAVKPTSKAYWSNLFRTSYCPNYKCRREYRDPPGSILKCKCGEHFKVVPRFG